MKQFIKTFLLITLIGVGINGCADLESTDYSEITPSNFPKTEEDLQAMVLSCYNPLRGSWYNGIYTTSENGVMFVNDATTEILTGTWGAAQLCSELNFFPETTEVTRFYYTSSAPNGFLNKISRCTIVLNQIQNSTVSEDLKTRYSAEVRCARGHLAYILYDMYGALSIAPIDVLLNPLEEKPLARLTAEETAKFIEDDLLYAAENLPYPSETEYGKFSKGLAKMLLIRLYLHETTNDNSYYDKVEVLARELMGSNYGYKLMSDYPHMFELGGQGSANSEFIWAIPSSYDGPNENQWHMMALPTDFNQGGMSAGWGTITSTWWFYDTFENGDTRKTYLLDHYTNTSNEEVNRMTDNTTLALGPIPLKYGYDPGTSSAGGLSNIDIVVYRYADVLLSLSEALVMKDNSTSSDLEEALGYINQIRERAKLNDLKIVDVNTKETFINHLLIERSHEFWCENGQYRADLIRFDKFISRATELTPTIIVDKTKELYPIPLASITDGKGAVIQNPGYDK